MYFGEKEKEIIRTFYNNIEQYKKSIMSLKWFNQSQITAIFDTCFDDDNELEMDDTKYEEYVSFVFKALDLKGEPPVYITEDKYFCVNYKNFPDEIIADGKKIN